MIKVENNIQEILKYLEIKGYIWVDDKKKPTENIPSALTIFTFSNKTIGYNDEHTSIEAVSLEQFKKENPMKKSDLKPGMVVEYANGVRQLVVEVDGKIGLIDNDGFNDLDEYNDDLVLSSLEYSSSTIIAYRIDKIYKSSLLSLTSMLDTYNLSILWERPKETVLTMQEIADKFGIPVEQLKIKK